MIIGLGYKARSGKDTVADRLVKRHGFTKRAFADALKEACAVIFQLNHDQLYGDLKGVVDPFWKTTPRDILQRVGTEAMRVGFDANVWVNSWRRYLKENTSQENWVVPDVRFPNEAEAVKNMGGVVVRVDRDGRDAIDGQKHASETSMEGYGEWDYVIDNNSNLNDLYLSTDRMLKELG